MQVSGWVSVGSQNARISEDSGPGRLGHLFRCRLMEVWGGVSMGGQNTGRQAGRRIYRQSKHLDRQAAKQTYRKTGLQASGIFKQAHKQTGTSTNE